MGQKVSPIALRIGINKDWLSRWYANKKDYGPMAVEDERIRKFIKKEYSFAGLQKIEIERNTEKTIVIVYCAKPSFIIGRRGIKADKLTEDLIKLCHGRMMDLKVVEVMKPELSAQLVGDSIAQQLEKQSHHRRIMHKAIETVLEAGALGIKIKISGRIGGAEIARAESLSKGKIPLHTLKADIDYARSTATLSKGTVGVKVWIYKGESERSKKTPAVMLGSARGATAPIAKPESAPKPALTTAGPAIPEQKPTA
jgi:small subunit ribosomal protein S3